MKYKSLDMLWQNPLLLLKINVKFTMSIEILHHT